MSDGAWDYCCHACASGWINHDGPQCSKDPHSYKTGEQQAIARWLTVGRYVNCPGFSPSEHELVKIKRRRIRSLRAELDDLTGESE